MEKAIQLAQIALQLYFAVSEMANLNEEQKEAMYKKEEQKFNDRDPDKLISL